MLRNYFKTAIRRLLTNKIHSAINILALSVGMAVSLLIGLWIWDELSFDKYNKNYDTIAQLGRKETVNGESYIGINNNHFPIPLAAELRTHYGNYFKHIALCSNNNDHILSFDNHPFTRPGMYVEPDFLNMITLNMIAGSSDLRDPSSILIDASMAHALFGQADPIGKVIRMDSKQEVKVSGVFEDLPYNTRFSGVDYFCPWNLLVNTNDFVKNNLTNWNDNSFEIFAQTIPATPMGKISDIIKDVYWSKVKDPQPASANAHIDLFLHPMKDWHLRSEWKNGVQAGGRIQLVWLFGFIGGFVLLLACINFMNLSTARSEKRAREVGLRKTMGSLRLQLIKLFLGESFIIVCLSFAGSLLLVSLSLSWFNRMADKTISLPFGYPEFWLLSVGFILVTALLAGSYPAFYLSSFQPVKVLKGTFRTGHLAVIPRRALIVLQFATSIILIIGTIVVYQQIQYGQNRPIGYNKQGLIRIAMNTPDLYGKYDVLEKELEGSGGAVGFAQSTSTTTSSNYFDGRFDWEGKDSHLPQMSFALMGVTYDFGKTVGWEFAAGRDFSRDFASDSGGIILNEAAIKFMNLKDPVGKMIKRGDKPFRVVGVIKDMLVGSPYEPVQMGAFFLVPNAGPYITVRLNPHLSAAEAIGRIAPIFKRYNPSGPFDYRFVDEEYGGKFAAEQRIGVLAAFFTILAVLISCLGIFGLASFVAEQRTREIGVRKVLGASVINLWGLLSREFVWLVAIAFIIAIPTAYYFMDQWLQKYNYRTHMNWWIFAVAGGGALVITLLTVSYQTVRAALMNPVKSLRAE